MRWTATDIRGTAAALDTWWELLTADLPTEARAGLVAGIFSSPGGVPKLPLPAADVDRDGIVGDRRAKRKHHGRVWQALSLWSAEVVMGLAAEGHPIRPGAAGENLSLRGLSWAALRPGVRLRIGEVLAELSMPATPCRQVGDAVVVEPAS